MALASVSTDEVRWRFDFHPATTSRRRNEHARVREMCGDLAEWLNDYLPEGREKAIALTKVQETLWAATASIALQGEDRGGDNG